MSAWNRPPWCKLQPKRAFYWCEYLQAHIEELWDVCYECDRQFFLHDFGGLSIEE